jgi:hypothetical protein
MKTPKVSSTLFFILLSAVLHSQSNLAKDLVGRIYLRESQHSFFQFLSKDSGRYYSINDLGPQELHSHVAKWKVTTDTTILLTVIYEKDENANFYLTYYPALDLFRDNDFPRTYRRRKAVSVDFTKFRIEEF